MDKDPAVILRGWRSSGTRGEGARDESGVCPSAFPKARAFSISKIIKRGSNSDMDEEAGHSLDLVRLYLLSVALILAVTAIGKTIPVFDKCRERPMLGSFQPDVSNDTILGLACVVEFGILGLICFCRRRWVPCLACSVWGGLCVLAHVISLGSGAMMTSCNCLGWFQQIIPLPKEVLSTILLVCAGWLALGGFAAFCFSWRRARPGLVLRQESGA